MTTPIDAFFLSLERDEPPPFATPMLRAIWHGLRGDWGPAHDLAQAQDDVDGAWVHAWLHRIEGDLANADHWHQRAHRPSRRDDTRVEGLQIATALIRSLAQCDAVEADLQTKQVRMRRSAFDFLRATYFRWARRIDTACPAFLNQQRTRPSCPST